MPRAHERGSDPLIGRTLDGRYLLEERVGRGGMGSVYRARHVLMDRAVAIKMLRPDLSADPTASRRFTREAKSTFRFDHPNCVRVTDFGGTEDGLLYLVMEYLDGRTIGDEIHIDGPMSPSRVARVCRQVCDALACAHDMGFVHRDLKPDNVMLIKRGSDPDWVKVLDFGLAKICASPDGAGMSAFSISPLTQEGTIFGTPEYMSPEQATDKDLDPRTDLYSLGVVAYEMVTGQLPFQAPTFMGILSKHVREVPVPPAQRRPDLGIPPELDAAIVQCLAKSPADRPASATTLSAMFAHMESGMSRTISRVPVEIAASATVDLGEADVAAFASGDRSAPITEGPIHISTPAEPTARVAPPGRRRSRAWLLIALASAATIAVVVATLIASGGRERASDNDGDSVAAVADGDDDGADDGADDPAQALADLVRAPAHAPIDDLALIDAGAIPSATVDAGVGKHASGSAKKQKNDDDEAKRRERARNKAEVQTHLRAAESARKSGNTLKQLAEADAARKLDGRSTRARYLLGDALVKSGDKTNGCKHLHRARSLSSARSAYSKAGCAKD